MNKLNNQYTVNFNDEYRELIEKLASIYQRKPAELLRLLLIPVLHDEYSKIMIIDHPENKNNFIKL